jgi:AraC family transcriptional regulator
MLPQINPRAPLLGEINAILTGTSTRYWVPDFPGTLSIKSVTRGEAVWNAANRRFPVTPSSYLVLQDRQIYSIEIDATLPMTTFCIFFRRGFVEDISYCLTASEDVLLQNPQPSAAGPLEFHEHLERSIGPVADCLETLRRKSLGENASQLVDDDFLPLVQALLQEESLLRCRANHISAARASTRLEVFRRVLRGRDFLLSMIGEPCNLDEIAKAAALSPFHFHRAFKAVFRQTPHDYLIAERLRHAKHLLRSGRYSVLETCLACGFSSLGSFSSLFHKKFGISPAAFKDPHRKFRKIEEAPL